MSSGGVHSRRLRHGRGDGAAAQAAFLACEEGVAISCLQSALSTGCEGPAAHAAAWAALRHAPDLNDPALRPRCQHEVARAVATREHCEVTGCAKTAVTVHTHAYGHLTARHVHVASCGSGFAEFYLGARSVCVDCSATACEALFAAAAFRQGSTDGEATMVLERISGVRCNARA